MKRTLFAATALAALSLTACKKDKDNETTGGGTPAQQYLKKFTETQNGVATVFTLTYDNQHRLLNFKNADNSETTAFTYDAAGNLVKVEETEPNFFNVYTYTYANGKPATATFKSWQRAAGQPDQLFEDDVLTYTVTNNRVSAIHLEMLQDGDEADFNLTYNADGELAEARDGQGFYKANFTYGTHKSAFPSISPWILDQAGFSLLFYTRHELLSTAYDFPGTALDRTETTTYTFNAAGYPTTATRGSVTTTFEYQ
ncbi:hypothetical protein [Flaviaesturariibacter aridisoli]|uniref:DUF4595 domain-containing protein n=1 Tax=Flaviaesturariibacter aridisoli TaxID=2545761 RepID=A0A4R4DZF1_9BACT|nr:hypothetical protein [Flaviaesturariibacter aridisoli]TCZ71761.1 hypothetical protein E0486_09410 [Flaviaesturariibacter aridisoli]